MRFMVSYNERYYAQGDIVRFVDVVLGIAKAELMN